MATKHKMTKRKQAIKSNENKLCLAERKTHTQTGSK